MAGITLPPVQQLQKGGIQESMYDATGQLKIKSLGGAFSGENAANSKLFYP